MVYPHNRILAVKKHEVLTAATTWRTLKTACNVEEARHTGCVLCDSIYMKYPEREIHRQRADSGYHRLKGGKSDWLSAYRSPLGVMKMFWN